MRIATLLVVLLLTFGAVGGVRAEVKFVAAEPAAHTFQMGALSLTALRDAQILVANDGKTFGLGVSPRAVGNVLRAAGAPPDQITLSVDTLLVRTGRRLVLIDTGLGPRYHGALPGSLKLVGVSPGDVTDVLITHPHPDHIGGLLDAQGRLAFPNAKIRMASPAWMWLKQKAAPAVIGTIAARIQTFEPGATVAPGIRSIALPGHTPGHSGYEIRSGRSRLIDIGDLAHSSIVSLVRPQWAIEFDNDPVRARQTRLRTLAALAGSHERVFAPHFPFPGVGHIVAAKQGFAWKPDPT
ncbi:MAG TPA: MBL fold metallo-hydrolase [Steroidobacteraceae bacterium]|jgi:glyoxylase-like metal-dependent hydrolase (beta-lactamase superfamily II)